MAKSKLSPLRVRDGLFLPCPTRALSVFLCCCLVHSGVCFPPFTPTQSKIIRITSSQRKRFSPPFPFFSSPSLFPLSPSFFPPTPSFVNSSVAFFGRPQSRKIFQLAVSFPAPLFNPETLRTLLFGTHSKTHHFATLDAVQRAQPLRPAALVALIFRLLLF